MRPANGLAGRRPGVQTRGRSLGPPMGGPRLKIPTAAWFSIARAVRRHPRYCPVPETSSITGAPLAGTTMNLTFVLGSVNAWM